MSPSTTMLRKMLFRFCFFLFPAATLASCHDAPTGEPAEKGDTSAALVQTPVTVTSVSHAPMIDYFELNATSAFLLKSFVKANINGYLQSSGVRMGQYVSKGQQLFTVKTKEALSVGNAVNSLDSTFRFSGTNTIRAGEKGFITQINHQPGDYVQDGEQLAVISDLNSFVFLMDMPYELRPFVIGKKNVDLLLPDGERLQGYISATMPTVDPAAQTQGVVIRVNSPHQVPENLVAKVRIAKSAAGAALSLPKSALLTDETQTSFWIMKMLDSVTAVKVPVKKGMEIGGRVEILSPPLSDSDRILVSGNYGLSDTARVKITGTIKND